jgi:hypothetical protein
MLKPQEDLEHLAQFGPRTSLKNLGEGSIRTGMRLKRRLSQSILKNIRRKIRARTHIKEI